MDYLQGSIRIPIRMNVLVVWALRRCLGTLPLNTYTGTTGPLVFGFKITNIFV
jgi:hypothetical protein